jgi:arylsulfatase A
MGVQRRRDVPSFHRPLILLLATSFVVIAPFAEQPNIVIMMADDLGYGDIGCYGSTIRTPNIDQLAKEGIRFTDYYAAAPNCSPSRAGLLTGRIPSRVGVYDYVPPDSPMHLLPQEVTIAEMLKPIGYETCHVGKWHLSRWQRDPNAILESPTPGDQGFDYWFATDNNAIPSHKNPINFIRNGQPLGALEGYACQIVADEAIGWLQNRESNDEPFYLNVWFNEPHKKIASPPEIVAQYDGIDDDDALYFANVTNLDDAVGRILKTLDSLELRENTLVFFTSDNGPWRDNSSGPLRAKKSSLYEGGIRVPGIIRWPGRIRKGDDSRVPVGAVDIFPTIAAINELALPKNKVIDGTSLLPLFSGMQLSRSTPLMWFFYKSTPMCVLRDGDFVIAGNPSKSYRSKSHPIDQTDFDYLKTAKMERFELYNLRNDIGQEDDLASAMPGKLESLSEAMRRTHSSVITDGPDWPDLPADTPSQR